MIRTSGIAIFLATVIGPAVASAADAPPRTFKLADDCEVRLLSKDEAAAVLGSPEKVPYVGAMSHVDLELRLRKTLDPKTRVENLEALRKVRRSAVRDWTDDQARLMQQRLTTAHKLCSALYPGVVPRQWKFIQAGTEGEAEANGYTVDDVIVINAAHVAHMATGPEDGAIRFLLHETFHVISRTRPEIRKRAYAVIGFREVKKVKLSEALEARRLTNPDGLAADVVIDVTGTDGRTVPAVPVIWSREPGWSPAVGNKFFAYLEFGLFALKPVGSEGEFETVGEPGKLPPPLPPRSTKGFFEQIGRNTNYIIHPDEILADNFVLSVIGSGPGAPAGFVNRYDMKLLDRLKEAIRGK